MKNLFLMAAVVALSMGFAACSDNDENGGEGTVNQSFCLEFLNVDDTTECQYIESAYQKVTGGTEAENRQFVTLQGKDSLTCLAQFRKLCEQAESSLSGKEFQTNTCVYGYTSGQDSIYGKVYGTLENYTYRTEAEHFSKGRNSTIDLPGVGVSGLMPLHCVQLSLEWVVDDNSALYGFNYKYSDGWNASWPYVQSTDINMGMGSWNQRILAYLYYGQGASNPGDITDVRILDNGSSSEHPSTLLYDGRNYKVVDRDLNEGLGGNHLYICYTRDYYDNQYLTGKQTIFYRHRYFWKDWIAHSFLDISKEDIQSTLDQYTAEGYIPVIVPSIYWGGSSYTQEWEVPSLHTSCPKNNKLIWVVCYRKY